jgi:hypothetical protein
MEGSIMKFHPKDKYVVHVLAVALRMNLEKKSTEVPMWIIRPVGNVEDAILVYGAHMKEVQAVSLHPNNALAVGEERRVLAILVSQVDMQVQIAREGTWTSFEGALKDGRLAWQPLHDALLEIAPQTPRGYVTSARIHGC